jgi:hypothetical protein
MVWQPQAVGGDTGHRPRLYFGNPSVITGPKEDLTYALILLSKTDLKWISTHS